MNENTPLNPEVAKKIFGEVFSDTNVSMAKEKLEELKKGMQDGDFSIRLLALVAAFAIVVSAFLGIFKDFFTLNFPGTLVEVYTLALGVIMLILESKQLNLPESFMNKIFHYALFLKFVWGRGILYLVAGTLQITQGSIIDYGVGGFCAFCGIVYIIVGNKTANKMKILREALVSEDTLRAKFREADTKNTGSLDAEQFKKLTDSIGMNLNKRTSEAAFLHLDKSQNGKISYEEFKQWWTEFDASVPIV